VSDAFGTVSRESVSKLALASWLSRKRSSSLLKHIRFSICGKWVRAMPVLVRPKQDKGLIS
jgi:hypothetical protein